MFKTRFISMLVLLAAVATGAWAQEQSETIVTTDNNIVEGTHFTISNNGYTADEVGMCADGGITVTPKNGETITKVVISCTYGPGYVYDYNTSVSSGTKEITNGGLTITVTGVNASTFTFTCSDDGAQFGQFVVYYTPTDVTGLTLSQTEASLTVGGETLTLTPTVAPGNATDKTVTWTTSDAAVATVANGVVTAVGAGTATITATATNGTDDTSDDKTATCTVTVSPAGYSVTLKEGTDDATNWQGKAGEGEYQALPLEGVAAGTAVTVKYNGTKKVKSVKAKKKAAAAPALNLTSPAVGQVIGSDGKNYAYGSLPTGVTAVAMIAYVSGSNGLAIALSDESTTMNWSTATTTAAAHTPVFTNGTWKLPSQDEWKNMFKAFGGNESSYSGLQTAITNAGGTALQHDKNYWSSTENASYTEQVLCMFIDMEEDYAVYYNSYVMKSATNVLVRPVLAF